MSNTLNFETVLDVGAALSGAMVAAEVAAEVVMVGKVANNVGVRESTGEFCADGSCDGGR